MSKTLIITVTDGQQVKRLAEYTVDRAIAEGLLDKGGFAIPKRQTLAPTYSEAVQKVLNLIKQQRNGNFYNYREGRIG